MALVQNNQGRIWMGSEFLHCFDPKSKTTKVISERIAPDFKMAWSFYASEKRLWIGLNNGLAYLDFVDENTL